MNDLALDFTGIEVQKIITCTIEGIVEPADLAQLLVAPTPPTATGAPTDLKKLRERHHSVARLMASGLQQTIVCEITGYTDAYLSTLLNAPSMQELIEYYRASQNNAAEAIAERLRSAGMSAVDILVERMEADECELDNNELLGLAKLGLDRSGHGPQSKNVSVSEHHLFDHAQIQELNRRARRDSAEDFIELEPLPTLPAPDNEKAS